MPILPRGGQAHPVAPPPGPLALLVGRGAEGVDVEPSRVEPLQDPLDGLALAGAVGAARSRTTGTPAF